MNEKLTATSGEGDLDDVARMEDLMQLINVELISDAERQDGDGKCKIAVRYADGTE